MYSKIYTRYVATVLLLVYIFNQLDRGVFSILMEPLRRQFSLTDTQLGFAVGPALVVMYSLLGVPIARLGDRTPRIRIMTVAIALWSILTVLTAATNQFWQLALARVGVGIGEAGFSAIAVSVIGDYESDENRPRALAYFMLAVPIASFLSDFFGGWVNEFYGWRSVFVIAGLPGILLAVLMLTTIREPTRRQAKDATEEATRPPFRQVLSTLWQRRSLRHLMLAQGIANIAPNAIGWTYVYFIRQYHMGTGELGSWFAASDLVTLGGVWMSGWLAARLGAAGQPSRITRVLAGGALLMAPMVVFVLWCPSKTWALVAYLLLTVPMYGYIAPVPTLVQNLVGPSMRATIVAIYFLAQMLLGGVLGTQLVGAISDVLLPLVGDSTAALRWSMALVSMATLWAAVHFWLAGRYVQEDLRAGRSDPDDTGLHQHVDPLASR